MNSSNKRHELWVQCCNELHMTKRNIDNDVPHRWNSTYGLLQVAVDYKLVLNRYVQKLHQSSRFSTLALPTEEDWLVATIVCRFLKIFDSSTKILCGVYYPTSCRVIPCLVGINATFNKYAHFSVVGAALHAMKTKFDKYWKEFPIVFCLSVAMDPRYKFFAIGQWLASMGVDEVNVESTIVSLKHALVQLYECYGANVVPEGPTSSVQPGVSSMSVSTCDPIVFPDDCDDYADEVIKKAKTSTSTSSSSSDLQYYIDMPILDLADGLEFNLLGWWRSHEAVYPVLSLVARDLLTVPASTVASEAAFSAGGRVVSEKRASLSPNTIQALICLKDWKLADVRKQDMEQEEHRAEDILNARLARPNWMTAIEGMESGTTETNIETTSN